MYKGGVKDESAFTFAEMIVTISILGMLVAIAIPKFTELTFESKIRQSEANIISIQTAFMKYYFDTMFRGQQSFPEPPVDSLMTVEWSYLPILMDEEWPANLFMNGKLPLNPDGNPFVYARLIPDENSKFTDGIILRDPDYGIVKVLTL